MFGDVLVAFVVVVCLSSLVTQREERENRHLSKRIFKETFSAERSVLLDEHIDKEYFRSLG